MLHPFSYRLLAVSLTAIAWCSVIPLSVADQPKREGPWIEERSPEGKLILTSEMTLHGQGEPEPALKIRLVPDSFSMTEGNSAIYYLKAMGFLEQEPSHAVLREFHEKSRKQAEEQGLTINDFPPYSWHNMPPEKLPLTEVKQYLSYTSFQLPLLEEATRRAHFQLDRNIREVASPIGYLLPEIQSMRDLAKLQSLRCRVAIAEQRIDDAIKLLSQQFVLARHLGQDEFLISNLVGCSIVAIALQDAIYLLQQPNAPNLYWAFASLPTPMIDMQRAFSVERQFLMLQIKPLADVNETPRPAGYWQDFIDRVGPQLRELELIDSRFLPREPDVERAALVSVIAAAYPGAKRYLLEDCHIDRAKVDAYPTAQVVFLALRRFNEQLLDDQFKWANLPYDQARLHPDFQQIDQRQLEMSQRLGWTSQPVNLLITSIANIRAAQIRSQQQIALLQTVEAIRMYGKSHAGKLPSSLDALPFPAPRDPVSGKPFEYQASVNDAQSSEARLNDTRLSEARLSGEPLPSLQLRFKLKFGKE